MGPPDDAQILIDGVPYPIKPPTICERYLGVRVGISGSMEEEYKYRFEQSRQFAAAVNTITSRQEANLAYLQYYLSKIPYPLPVTTFTDTQLNRIESPSIRALLPKLGYNRHFPRKVVFGPTKLGGMGMQPLRFLQGYNHVKLLRRVLNNDTKVTQALRILLRYTTLEAGTPAIFGHDRRRVHRILQYLTPTWATTLLQFQSNCEICTNLESGCFHSPLQRQHDVYIMDVLLQITPHYRTSELRSLNRVRLYLQVYSKACITDSITGLLDRRLLHKRTAWTARPITLIWPNVHPKPSDWVVWSKALLQAFPAPTVVNKMGLWHCTHQKWPLWNDPPPPVTTVWHHDDNWGLTIVIDDQEVDTFSLHGAINVRVHGSDLRSYIRYRTGWTDDQYDNVNWDALDRVITLLPMYCRTTIMKAVYGWLHTSHWQERIYGTSPHCAMCNQLEDNEHLWTCPSQTHLREQALLKLIASLTAIGSPISGITIIQHRLNTFLHLPDSSPSYDVTDPLVPHILQAAHDQDQLGWDNFMRGRHSRLWAEAYDAYIETRPKTKYKYKKGATWAAELVRNSLKLLTTIWINRNEELHDATHTEKSMSEQRAHARVTETYESMNLYPQLVRDQLFHVPLTERLQQQPFTLIKWLETVADTKFNLRLKAI